MSSYAPNAIQLANSLNEAGITLGMRRLPGESLYNYQRRLILETKVPAGVSEADFIKGVSRRIGLFDTKVFSLDLVLSAGVPVAVDPRIVISSSKLTAWSNYTAGVVSAEVDFYSRDSGYFLEDIIDVFSTNIHFALSGHDVLNDKLLSQNLRVSSSKSYYSNHILNPSIQNKLPAEHILDFHSSNVVAFVREVATIEEVVLPGDYYFDRLTGNLFSAENQSGYVSFSYNVFPFEVFYQPVKAYAYNDSDNRYFHYNTLLSDTSGEPAYNVLNAYGARIANAVLAVHPLTWGS